MPTAAVRTCYLVAGIIGLRRRMNRCPLIAVAGLIGALLRTAGAADNLDALLTAEEGAEVDAVLAQAISLGFPEVRGGEWHTTKSGINGPFDLHLAGGTWLLEGYRPEPKQENETPAVDAAALAGALATKSPPADLPWEFLRLPAEHRARLERAATISYSGFCSTPTLGERSEPVPNIALPGAILRRCALPGLGDRLLLQAQYQRTRAEYGLCLRPTAVEDFGISALPARRWDEHSRTLLLFEDEEIELWIRAAQSRSAQAPLALTLIPVTTVLRRECHWWFRQRLIEAKPAAAPTLAAAALAMLTAEDRMRAAEDIARLLARAGISEHPAPGAGLAERLAAWDLGPFNTREPWMITEWDSIIPLTPAELRERFPAQVPGGELGDHPLYDQNEILRSCAGEIAGLVDLLGSSAPSRWLESGTPRTLGDDALRALTLLWSVDPRVLVGRDRSAAWTPEEREATATEVQRFWRAQRENGIDAAIRTHLAHVPAWCLARYYRNAAPDQRTLLVARMVAAWKDGPPGPLGRQEADDGEMLLAALAKDPAFVQTIRSWPIQGPMARTIMLAHELAGDRAPLDDLLRRVAVGENTPADLALTVYHPYEREFAISLMHPSAARVRLLAGILTADPIPPAWEAALIGLMQDPTTMASSSNLEEILLQSDPAIDARAVLQFVVLGDQRSVPQVVRDSPRWGRPGTQQRAGEQTDLRICDLAMRMLANADDRKAAERGPGTQVHLAAFELSLPRAERDAVITARRQVLHVLAGKAASQLKLTAADYRYLKVTEATSDF